MESSCKSQELDPAPVAKESQNLLFNIILLSLTCNTLGPQMKPRDLPSVENEGKHDKNSNGTQKRPINPNQKCMFCDSEDLANIVQHNNLFHSNGCVFCPKNEDHGSSMSSQIFICNLCTNYITFKTDNELKEHRRSFHSLKCLSCRIGDAQKNIPDIQKLLQLQSKLQEL